MPGRTTVRSRDLVAAATAAYRTDNTWQEWLAEVGEACDRVLGGGGVFLYRYRCRRGRVEVDGSLAHVTGSTRFPRLVESLTSPEFEASLRGLHPGLVARGHLEPYGPTRMIAEAVALAQRHGRPEWIPTPGPDWQDLGFGDPWGMNVPDGRGSGLSLCCVEETPRDRPESHTRAMSAILPILQAAQRLRTSWYGEDPPGGEARLTPDGKIHDASGAARDKDVRTRLSEVVRRFDRSRAAREAGVWHGGTIWPGILDGRWSLVERFERDGRRFLVAHANAVGVLDPRRLDPSEKDVAQWAATGATNKEIAATLGCSVATVEERLSTSMRKLGVRSRFELILDYRGAPTSLAQRIDARTSDRALVALDVRPHIAFPVSLTAAQAEVATLAVLAHSNAEIARRRGTSVRTIANQLRAIFERCGVYSRAELMALALPAVHPPRQDRQDP